MKKTFLLPIISVLFLSLYYSCQRQGTDVTLRKGFACPPAEASVWTWWHWVNGFVSKEGITADLEAMKRVGLGGLYHFDFHKGQIKGPVEIMSEGHWELVRFAREEANRLGLEYGFHNCPGFATSGSPGVPIEHSMQKLVWSEVTVTGPSRYRDVLPRPQVDPKYDYYRDIVVLAFPLKSGGEIALDRVSDVSRHMDIAGMLDWDVPTGSWTVMRVGHTTTGKTNHPAPPEGTGLECDKMSKEALEVFFESYPALYLKQAGDGVQQVLIDSYEARNQDWTPGFREEFIQRRGYDPLPWLPAWADKTVESEDLSQRFRNDMRRTIAGLYDENYYGHFATLARRHGLKFALEPYNGPYNHYDVAAHADILMAEFWVLPVHRGWLRVVNVTASANVLGKKIVSSEAFTGWPQHARWENDPFSLKAITDRAFALGVNRLVLHTTAHQPWDDRYRPGMSMYFWGTQFGRFQTWWEQSKVWFDYLSRCQYLLQQGEMVRDILSLERLPEDIPSGYQSDICSEAQLISLTEAKNGKLALPQGRAYSVLVVSDSILRPEVARKIRSLAEGGVTVLGKPFVSSPSLQDYPDCDQEVREISERLFSGGLVRDLPLSVVLEEKGMLPDFSTGEKDILWVHRVIDGKDVYFLSNQQGEERVVECVFRVTGKQPELWDASTGSMVEAGSFTMGDGLTRIPVKLDAYGSVFVVFSRPTAAREGSSAANWSVCSPAGDIPGPWTVRFDTTWGGPAEVVFDTLQDWATSHVPGIKYYSGTAVYATSFELGEVPSSLCLDLGRVKNLAEVEVNDHSLGVLWKPPFRVDVSGAARLGANTLTVKVTNLWANRLIGDEQEPADVNWGINSYFRLNYPDLRGDLLAGRNISEVPDWLLKGKPRPSRHRYTFTTFNYFREDTPLLESGLMGPVRLMTISE